MTPQRSEVSITLFTSNTIMLKILAKSRVNMYVSDDAHPWGDIKLLGAPPTTPSDLISN
jgi:hypothetical protein